MAYRKRKDVDTRRRGHDDRRMATDIHICRWFSLFLKITKELEDRKVKLELFGKQHLVKLNRSENWFKKIDLNKLPKTPKFLRFEFKNYYKDTSSYFDNYFWLKYRDLFQEPKTQFIQNFNNVDMDKYDVVIVPKHFSQREARSDFLNLYQQKEVKLKKGRKKTGESRHKADIVLTGAKDEVLKRLFHIFRISQTKNDEMTNLDIYSNYQNQIFKRPLIQVVRKTKDSGKEKTKDDYESQIRSTQRDIRQAKILILNLCKGHFPITDKLL